jgi:hypothetical protein
MEHDQEVRYALAETVHTAFRKGVDGVEAMAVHRAITDLPDEQWSAALDWMLMALDTSGYQIVRKQPDKQG